MRITGLLAAMAATSLVAAPVAAAPTSNPAQSLSIAGARAGTPAVKGEKALGGGGGLIALGVVAGVIAIIVIAVTSDGDDNGPDSN